MRLLLPLLGLLLALPAAALELMPTTLQLPAEGGHAELWLHNPGPSRWQGQVHILAWEQHPDAEVLRPSDQILASPTQLDLAPGARQRIWLLPRQPAPSVGEQATGSCWLQMYLTCLVTRCRFSVARPHPWRSRDCMPASNRACRNPCCD